MAYKKHGSDLIGRCPFHDDKTPSLVITPEKNLWHCLGACQVGGTMIDWVMIRGGKLPACGGVVHQQRAGGRRAGSAR